jgi:hypothetical protein
LLLTAEADEHRAVGGEGALQHGPAEYLSEPVLIGTREIGVPSLVFDLDTIELTAAGHLFLAFAG